MKHEKLSDKVMKLAFLGGGVDSAIGMSHFTGLRMDRKFDLVAGCFSEDREVNIRSAQKYGVDEDRCHDSVDDLIANEKGRIEAVVILTPIDQHFDQVMKFLDSGIPIICEKSLTSSYKESVAVKKALGGNFLAVVYNYQGYPMVKEFSSIVQSGKVGSVKNIQVEMPSQGYCKLNSDGSMNTPQEWRLKDGFIPTISLDLATHLHSLVKFISNEIPQKVIANYKSFGRFNDVIDDVSLITQYSNDVSCNYWYSKSSFGYNNGMKIRVFCSDGAIEWVQERPEMLTLVDKYGSRKIIDRSSPEAEVANLEKYNRFKAGHPIGYMEAFSNYYADIHDLLADFQGGGSQVNDSIYSIDTAIEGLSLLNCASESFKEGSWKKIEA